MIDQAAPDKLTIPLIHYLTLKGQVLGIDFLIIGIIYIICGCLTAISEVSMYHNTISKICDNLLNGVHT